ncbi:M23 family metallopeptidase [Candidatus Woesearchaeota archaeon]|nr:M23 family metallopeptidase [Candidatus Woesearchaeota archaeon]
MSISDIVKKALTGLGAALAIHSAEPAYARKHSENEQYASLSTRVRREYRTPDRGLSRGFHSPFGGTTRPPTHECYPFPANTNAGEQEICPFDLYGARRRSGRHKRRHKGLDLYGSVGTPLFPMKPGTVVGAGRYEVRNGKKRLMRFWRNNGNSVKIRTDDGYQYMYIHMSSVNVRIGQKVGYDTEVGTLGTTGNRYAENPHVHIAVKHNGQQLNPIKYLGFLR